MNKKYQKNIEKQKAIQEKIEELQLKQEILKEEQEEMEQIEILKAYRSIDISIDEFLEMMRNYKKEKQREKKIKAPEQVKENREKSMNGGCIE
ncbi:conjugal transfer protein [Filifactor alocis]|uniref:conjugal transfer protein n=1 Tax=Filifactor alocis TaxID=143361 RepID=UPI0028D88E5B|nr:conjugal transfer protein [Filifactor alocis]